MKVLYGITVQESNDPYVSNAEEALVGIAEAGLPGRFLVDMIPIMKHIPDWFPGAEFKRKAKHWRYINEWVSQKPWEFVKKQAVNPDYWELPNRCFETFYRKRERLSLALPQH